MKPGPDLFDQTSTSCWEETSLTGHVEVVGKAWIGVKQFVRLLLGLAPVLAA
jgi:hypothetical protein